MPRFADLHPDDVIDRLTEAGTRRAYWIWDPERKTVVTSHDFLESYADDLRRDAVDYDRHEGLFLEVGHDSGALLGAFVHRTVRGQAAGGVRLWTYDTLGDFMKDGIRLSKGMTHKNALAELWWGGGKGVIARPSHADYRNPEVRRRIYQDYGRMMSGLKGCYVTAEDAGTRSEDLVYVHAQTRFTTCIPERIGGSGNPSVPTALGVVRGMEAALETGNLGNLKGKTVAIQGLGNVGRPLAEFLFGRGVRKIVGSDVDAHAIDAVKANLPSSFALETRLVEKGDMSILFEDADIVAPCATGGTLNSDTIAQIKATIVCGAANNQLEVPRRDGPLLQERNITYVPDFLVNRMGIVNCANEQYGFVPGDTDLAPHLDRETATGIFVRTREVLASAQAKNIPPDVEAMRWAEELAQVPHPIWGHRGQRIIDGLVAGDWVKG